jgi:hypothetical protein
MVKCSITIQVISILAKINDQKYLKISTMWKRRKKKRKKEKKRIKINTYTHNPDILRWVGTLWKTEEIKILDRDILTAYEVLKLSINTTLYRKQMILAEIKN